MNPSCTNPSLWRGQATYLSTLLVLPVQCVAISPSDPGQNTLALNLLFLAPPESVAAEPVDSVTGIQWQGSFASYQELLLIDSPYEVSLPGWASRYLLPNI
jgi:hypothetical protein